MSIELITILMFLSMILLLITGRQIFVIVGAIGTIFAVTLWGVGGESMAFFAFYAVPMKWYPILALPPFIFMGLTLARSGVADKLFDMIYLWMGHVRGGLGMGTIGISALIATMSGESSAGTLTAGTIALPPMFKRGYDKSMVTGLVQAGGALGILIPPSIVFIIYGMIAKVSIGHLWLAGVLPGILLAVMYIIYIGVRCYIQPSAGPAISPEESVSWKGKMNSLKYGIPPVILIFVVLGLLFMGVTSIIECSAIGAVGAVICAAINRRLTRKGMMAVMDETLKISVMVLWIFAAALLFSSVFDGLGAIHAVEPLLTTLGGGNRWGIMIVMQFTFILMGMILDDTAMLLIVAPLYIPIVAKLGFSLVWFGVLYVINCQIAYLTPPFGYNLFIMKGIIPIVAPDSGITMGDIYKSVLPFVGIQALCLGVVMIFPQIALWLPSLVFAE